MKNILVPVDFSEQSVHAFRFALEIAVKSNGTIELLHVIALPVLHDNPLVDIEGLKKPLVLELKELALQKMRQLCEEFNPANVPVELTVITSNQIHDTLLDRTKQGFDLVVMGTKGASGLREWIMGSSTEKMVRNSPVPVIAIKSYTPGQTIRHIVFPTTLNPVEQEELVTKIKGLQNFFHATLHIIWINTPVVYKPDFEVRKKMEAFARRFMLKDYTINVFNYTDEESGIAEFSKQVNADLIAMSTHGLTGLAHLVSGSIAEDVVNHVQIPVWTYRTRSSNVTAFK